MESEPKNSPAEIGFHTKIFLRFALTICRPRIFHHLNSNKKKTRFPTGLQGSNLQGITRKAIVFFVFSLFVIRV